MASQSRPRKTRVALRILIVALIATVAVLLTTTVTNNLLQRAERSPQLYGQRVDVGHGSLNVYQTGDRGPTVVMLSGYGTAAPAIDYAPLIREMDEYRVVVVEGFGYGYSDLAAPARTIENITEELHTALSRLKIEQPYVLLGHSISGLYTLYYANEYRSEVAAVVGIDASVPGQMNGLAGGRGWLERFVSATGLVRVITALDPAITTPDGESFTEQEIEQMRMMTAWTYANPAIADEACQMGRALRIVADMAYPSDLPVISFIKEVGSQEGWRELHLAQLEGLDDGRLVELDGGHYLHWTHSPEIAAAIAGFLGEVGVTE